MIVDNKTIVIDGEVSLLLSDDGDTTLMIQDDGDACVSIVGTAEERETYEGPYELTPGAVDQVLETENRILLQNILVHAIPQNYGLITWDGVKLTVS